jgi:hypothetical protein
MVQHAFAVQGQASAILGDAPALPQADSKSYRRR